MCVAFRATCARQGRDPSLTQSFVGVLLARFQSLLAPSAPRWRAAGALRPSARRTGAPGGSAGVSGRTEREHPTLFVDSERQEVTTPSDGLCLSHACIADRFYNIGWTDSQLSCQNHEMHRKQLRRDCAGAFEFNDLGMLRLCEVGTDKLTSDAKRPLTFRRTYCGPTRPFWTRRAHWRFGEGAPLLPRCISRSSVRRNGCRTRGGVDWPGGQTWPAAFRRVVRALPRV